MLFITFIYADNVEPRGAQKTPLLRLASLPTEGSAPNPPETPLIRIDGHTCVSVFAPYHIAIEQRFIARQLDGQYRREDLVLLDAQPRTSRGNFGDDAVDVLL